MWDQGGGYERFMGRWSRLLAQRLVADALADGAARGHWLDVGCGTGSLTAACLAAGVDRVDAVDPSPAFVAAARARFGESPVSVHEGDAADLAGLVGPYDAVLSALVLNFTPDPVAALRSIRRVLRPAGTARAAVWHYADDRSFLGRFWQAVADVNGQPVGDDERFAFPICTHEQLAQVAHDAGWERSVEEFDVATTFANPADLWEPFLAGVGPAGQWVTSQPPTVQQAVRDRFVADVFDGVTGPITLPFRTLVVRTSGRLPSTT